MTTLSHASISSFNSKSIKYYTAGTRNRLRDQNQRLCSTKRTHKFEKNYSTVAERPRCSQCFQPHPKTRYTEKKARNQAYAFRLELVRLGQQVAHAFAAAQSLCIQRKDPLPPPDFWYQLKRHSECKGFRYAADAEIQLLQGKKTFEILGIA